MCVNIFLPPFSIRLLNWHYYDNPSLPLYIVISFSLLLLTLFILNTKHARTKANKYHSYMQSQY